MLNLISYKILFSNCEVIDIYVVLVCFLFARRSTYLIFAGYCAITQRESEIN